MSFFPFLHVYLTNCCEADFENRMASMRSLSLSIYLYIWYMCMYICVCIYVYVYMCMYICVCVYIYMYMYMYICICICVYIYIYVYMCICGVYIYIYIYVCMYVYIYICWNRKGKWADCFFPGTRVLATAQGMFTWISIFLGVYPSISIGHLQQIRKQENMLNATSQKNAKPPSF